ncbi:aspartic peptidase domain-containing protein [Aspergillus coremiiformis]|uniref:Aspartic peptidase domain-containing protein n=1 Tax=Aspergillus coremiiformis TaxID=138285 RepID=A0A5N6YX29_9EURO|nr:aspartic peptidase domain-containing protein [Aspergillus coremiiformis]
MIAAWLYTSGGESRIPSYSYGMHIGSVNPAIPGSLVLGGYDKSRVLGEVSSQSIIRSSGTWQIGLKDIGLEVAAGGSPFGFTSKNGLFMQGSGVVAPRSVVIDPTKPYMYLPEPTCDAITAFFPVSFDSTLGLYIWDTTRNNYANITSSATYLSFLFKKDGLNDKTITIKIPLKLLTLTLQDPLVDQNLTYFPCFHSTDTPVLGRAFLQAAFVGVNWFEGNNAGTWFLGQAPGPGLPSADITAINVGDTTLAASSHSWNQSWAKSWHPLADSSPGNSTSSNGDLTTGGKAGIGIGVGVVGVIFIAAGAWIAILRRRRYRPSLGEQNIPCYQEVSELPPSNHMDGLPEELDADHGRPQEMMGRQRHELE